MEETEPQRIFLGRTLRQKREELGLLVNDVAHGIQATGDYIRALEEENYKIFSAKVYAFGFFKKTLDFLDVKNEEKENLLVEFENQWRVRELYTTRGSKIISQKKSRLPVFTLARLSLASLGLILIFFFIFFSSRMSSFLLPPRLKLEEPQNNLFVEEPRIEVRGSTEKESRLSVNGRDIPVNESGYFSEKIELVKGLNELEFYVQNRFGKTNKIVRYIVVKS